MKKHLLFFALIFYTITSIANNEKSDTSNLSKREWVGNLELSTYVEAYYQYDFNQPRNALRPGFVYSFHRNNIPNINIALVKLNYSSARIRVNAGVMGGTYSVANLANEPTYLRNIFEANIGFNLLKRKQLWLDIGVLPSHIGFESAIGKDCRTLTRSMMADNSPYFETGARLSYTSDNGKLMTSVLLLNGWQRIRWINGNSLPSVGWQIQGKPNEKWIINSSGFAGTDKVNAERKMRYFHNFYIIYTPIEKTEATIGFDVGAEQKSKAEANYNIWYSPVLMVRYVAFKQMAIAARWEYYSDKGGAIITSQSTDGFQTFGYSLCVDALPYNGMLLRLEGKLLQSISGASFEKRTGDYSVFSPSLAIAFSYSFAHVFFKRP